MNDAQATQIIFLSKYSDEEICNMVSELSSNQKKIYDKEFDELGMRGALFMARSYPVEEKV